MAFETEQARNKIRAKIQALARDLGRDARSLGDDDLIPASGLLDSAAILGLIVWCELEFQVTIEMDEITTDNFGSVNRMLGHLQSLAA
jgi:D-alanine--poly(phosphoribitol) ligase subunit 2